MVSPDREGTDVVVGGRCGRAAEGVVVRCDRGGVRSGSTAGGATAVGVPASVGGGVDAGEVGATVDSPGPAGSSGSGGPAR